MHKDTKIASRMISVVGAGRLAARGLSGWLLDSNEWRFALTQQ